VSETSPTLSPDPLDAISWEASAASAAYEESPDIVSNDVPPGANTLECENCGRHFHHEGRGRKPKRCLECRGTKSPAAPKLGGGGRKGPRTKAEREADAIAAKLRQSLGMVALFVSMADPIDGKAILAGSEGLSSAAGTILERNEKLRILLSTSNSAGGYIAFVGYLLVILVPILAHHGVIPGEVTRGGKKVPMGELLESVPDLLLGMQKKLANAEQDLARKIAEAQSSAV
jgi:hypothetical protein